MTHPGTRTVLFLMTFAVLVLAFLGARAIVTSKLGRVVTAVRDGETRLMFLGYSPLAYKLFVWTLSAVLCGIAGALYVPQVGIINPGEMSPGNSIEMAIWVAVGRTRNVDRSDHRRVCGEWREELLYRLLCRVLAVLSGSDFRAGAVAAAERDHGPAPVVLPRQGGTVMSGKPGIKDMIPAAGSESGYALSGVAGTAHAVRPGEIDISHGTILYLEDVTVSFDGFRALNALTLSIDAGELRCVIGPEWRGQDDDDGRHYRQDVTGFREGVPGSVDRPDADERAVDRPRGHWQKVPEAVGVRAAPRLGKSRTGDETDKRWFASLRARLDADAQMRIEETLELIRLEGEARRPAGELSHGQKQRLEIGMLLMQQPALLLLDEPAAGMTDDETMELAQLLDKLRGTCSMMVVEHDMEFVAALAGGRRTSDRDGRRPGARSWVA